MTHGFRLLDDAGAAIEFHVTPGKPGRPRVDDGRVISGISCMSLRPDAAGVIAPNV